MEGFTLVTNQPNRPSKNSKGCYYCLCCQKQESCPQFWTFSVSRASASGPWQAHVGKKQQNPVPLDNVPGLPAFLASRSEGPGVYYVVQDACKPKAKSLVCQKEAQKYSKQCTRQQYAQPQQQPAGTAVQQAAASDAAAAASAAPAVESAALSLASKVRVLEHRQQILVQEKQALQQEKQALEHRHQTLEQKVAHLQARLTAADQRVELLQDVLSDMSDTVKVTTSLLSGKRKQQE